MKFEFLKARYPRSERACLLDLESRHPDMPLRECTVLHCVPLFKNTLCMIETASHLGANLTVTTFPDQPFDRECIDLLGAAGVRFEPPEQISGTFDYILDTGAVFLDRANARRGRVELTRSGAMKYSQRTGKNLGPVISIDDSRIKLLEDVFGVADSFCRGLTHNLGALPKTGLIVIGAGKIGTGLACAGLAFANPVLLVDINARNLRLPPTLAKQVRLVSDLELIETDLSPFGLAVTATAVPDCITNHYPPELFRGKILATMGAADEWGPAFAPSEVLANKRILNFTLDEPTQLRFIDPSLAAMLESLIKMEEGLKLEPFQCLPPFIEKRVLSFWKSVHYEGLSEFQKALFADLFGS